MFDTYYPRGGTNDFIGTADTKEEIKNIITNTYNKNSENTDNVNILDTKTSKIIGHVDGKDTCNILDDNYDLSEEKLIELLIEIED